MKLFKVKNTKTGTSDIIQAHDIKDISCLLWDVVIFLRVIE